MKNMILATILASSFILNADSNIDQKNFRKIPGNHDSIDLKDSITTLAIRDIEEASWSQIANSSYDVICFFDADQSEEIIYHQLQDDFHSFYVNGKVMIVSRIPIDRINYRSKNTLFIAVNTPIDEMLRTYCFDYINAEESPIIA